MLKSESQTPLGSMLDDDVRYPHFSAESWKWYVLIIPVTLTQTAHLNDNMLMDTRRVAWNKPNRVKATKSSRLHSTPSSLCSVDTNENNKRCSETDAPSLSTLVFVRANPRFQTFWRAFVFQFLLDGVIHIYWITKKNSLKLSWLCNLICAIQLNCIVTVTLSHTHIYKHTHYSTFRNAEQWLK